ncbi:MAG: isoprenylcysteine carboxylmethyltransferase family protein [Alphaproteobacteria bacterium]|nr:isoprenylcysteine carboxylmethyltransferase family protein [Alphaproteobacteria bacterium]
MDHLSRLPAFAASPELRLLFWGTFGAWAAVELSLWLRDRRAVAGVREDRGSASAISLAITAAMFVAFSAPPNLPALRIPASPAVVVGIGTALAWSGIAFRLWAVRTLGRYFRVTVTTQDDHRLIDSGPYRRLANPSYTGAVVTLTALGIAIGNWLSVAALLLLPIAGFAVRIRVEEASLARRFGDGFAAYRRARWALIPFVW